ncbi:MAG: hypothetical protein HY752_03690 [Nitrospirae bacterium]|nr:hypothetical protein [Nitrospirota bacterium]
MVNFPSKILTFSKEILKTKKLYKIINLSLVIFIVFSAMSLTRNIIGFTFLKKDIKTIKPDQKTITPATPKAKDIMSYTDILEKNPFGYPLKLSPVTPEHIDKGEKLLSKLILVGTVVGHKKVSYAIFEDRANPDISKQEVFAYGKNVYDYGILTRIERGWVELKQGANTYKIQLTDTTQIIESKTQNTSIHKIGEKEYILDQRRVQLALNNPEQILTDTRFMPNIKDGKHEGFTLSEVKPGGLYESLGLRNGDVLLRVNGLEISNPEIAVQAMSALKGMDRVTLDITRSNTKMTMTYQIR